MALIVRDLTVEIDNKRIVEQVSFDVRAGDKVGLVGRNGAGKTTLFRALGGATTPKSGSVRLPDATGYLSQDPRSDAVDLNTPCLTHVLSGRGLDVAMERIEKLTIALEEDASMETIEAFSEAHEHFESLITLFSIIQPLLQCVPISPICSAVGAAHCVAAWLR